MLPDLLNASISELSAGLRARHFTSHDLVATYLARIAQVNPLLHAVLETNYRALDLAKQADVDLAAGKSLGPLHGIPILLKDCIATEREDDRDMQTTAGSYALEGSYPAGDAFVVKQLKEAGAIIVRSASRLSLTLQLGKAHQTAFGNYQSSHKNCAVYAWCSRGGTNHNAYVALGNSNSSSGGSAVAASIGLCATGVALDATGAILLPAHHSAVCGFRPTPGLVSRTGIISSSLRRDVRM